MGVWMHRSGLNQTACASHLISKLQLLAYDKDWDSAVTDLRMNDVFNNRHLNRVGFKFFDEVKHAL